MSAASGGGGTPLSILFKILGIEEGKAALKPIADELVKIQATADKTGASVSKALSGTKVDSSAVKTLATDLDKASTSSDKLAGSSDKAGKALKTESQAAKDLTNSTQSVGTNVEKIDKSNTKVESSAKKAGDSLKKEATEIKNVGSESKKASTDIDKTGDSLEKTATKADKTSASAQTLKTNFTASMGAVTSLSGGIVSLWSSFDSLGDAQLKVDKATLKLSMTQEALAAAQEKLNQLTASGVTSGTEYEAAVLNVQQAQDKLAISQGNLTNAQEDLNITQANFYTQIIPQGVAVLGSLTTLFATGKDSIVAFGGKMKDLATQLVSTDKSMKLISLTNPFFLALTIGGGIVAAFATNLFGFRDAINWVGEALGNALPFLKPFLTMIGDIGAALTGFFGGATQEAQAYEEDTTEAMEGTAAAIEQPAKAANRTIGDLKRYGLDMSNVFINAKGEVVGWQTDYTNALSAAGDATKGLATETESNVNLAKTSLNSLVEEARTVAEEMRKVFTKTVDLGDGIQLSGFRGTYTDESGKVMPDPNTPSNLGQETKDRYRESRLGVNNINTVANLEKLTGVTTMYNSVTGELHVNLKQLEAEMKRLSITGQAATDVKQALLGVMNGVVETTSRDVSGLQKLTQETDAYNANLAKGMGQINLNQAAMVGLGGSMVGVTTAIGMNMGATTVLTQAQGEATTTTTNLAGATQQGAEAAEENASAQKNAAVSVDVFAVANERLTADMQAVVAESQYLTTATTDMASMMTIAAMGAMKQQNALKQQQLTLIETVAGLNEYNKQLETTEGQQTAMYQGMANQRDAFIKSKVAIYENIGVLEELKRQMASGEAQTVAYEKAHGEMTIQILNGALNVQKTRAEVDALSASMATGEAQTIRYSQAHADAEQEFLNLILSLEDTQAQIDLLVTKMKTGQAQNIAWNKGLTEGQLKIKQTTLALEEQKGTLDANNQALADGTLVQQAITRAQTEYQESVIQSAVEIESLQAQFGIYVTYLNKGIPQTLAFAKAQLDVQMASAKLHEELATLMGTYQATATSLDDMQLQTTKGNIAFMEGKRNIQEWRQSIFDAKNESAGMTAELILTGRTLNTEIPPALYANIAAMKEWIEVQARVPGAIENGLKKAADNAKESLSALYTELEEGGNLSEDDIEDALLAKIPDDLAKEVATEITLDFGDQQMAKQIDAQFGLLATLSGPLAAKVGQHIADDIRQGLHEKFAKGEISAEFYGAMQTMLNNMPSPSDSVGFQAWVTQFNLLTDAIETGASPETIQAIMDSMTSKNTDIENAAAALTTYEQALKATNTAISEYNKHTGGLFKNAKPPGDDSWYSILKGSEADKSFRKEGGGPTPPPGPTTQAGTVDTTGIDTAASKLNALNLALAAIPGTAAKVVSLANTEFDKLMPYGPSFAGHWTTLATSIEAMPAAIQGVIGQANTEFDKLLPYGPSFAGHWTTLATSIAAMPAAIQGVIGQANAEFDKLQPYGPNFAGHWTTLATSIAAMPAAIAGVVSSTNIEFDKLGTTLPTVALPAINQFVTDVQDGPFMNLQTNAAATAQAVTNIFTEEAGKMVGPYEDAVSDVNSGPFTDIQNDAAVAAQAVTNIFEEEAPKLATAYDGAIADVKTAFDGLETEVKSNLNNIFESAKTAAEQVAGLVATINALEDKTVTITTVYETVGSPATGAAKGFGPAIVDHPTMLLVGEAGPEYVNVTPLASGSGSWMTPDERLATYGDPGKERSALATKGRDLSVLYLAQGTTTNEFFAGNNNASTTSIGGRNNNNSDTGISNLYDMRLLYVGNKAIWNNAIPVEVTNAGSIGGGSSGGGGGGGSGSGATGLGNFGGNSGGNNSNTGGAGGSSNTGGSGGGGGGTAGSDWSHVQTSGGKRWAKEGEEGDPSEWRVTPMTDKGKEGKYKVVNANDKNVAAEFNSEAEAQQWLNEQQGGGGSNTGGGGSGNTPGGGSGNGGMGNTTPANQDPDTWIIREFEDGSIAVVDQNNNRVAKNFRNRQEARDYIESHQEAKQNNAYTSPTTGGEELDTSGGKSNSPDAIYRTPSHVQRVDTSAGGGTPGGGNGGNAPPYTGHPDFSHVQTTGTGKRWESPDYSDPGSWEIVPMQNDPSKYKIIDKNGKNIAANFNNEQEAQAWIDNYTSQGTPGLTPYPGGNNGGTTPPPPSNGTPGGTGGDASGGVSQWGDYDSATIQTSGTGKRWQGANQDPNSWKVVQMVDDPSKWKVVDNNDKNIAVGFSAEDQARGYIEDKKSGRGWNDISSPDYVSPQNVGRTPGGGGGNGTPGGGTPGGGNGTPGGGGGSYNPPDMTGVQTSGKGKRWQGANQDANTWRVVEMEDGSGRWKVVDDNNKNIAAGFKEEDAAGDYIAQQKDIQSGGAGTGGGGNGTPGGGTPGGGGNGTPGGVQASNLQALTYGDSDTYASAPPPEGMTFSKPTSGRYVGHQTGVDRNSSPEDWFIKKQPNGKFKVVTGDGKDVAVDFNTLADAQNFINWTISETEKRYPNRELGDPTLPLYRDTTTGKVYTQDASGRLYEQTGNYSDYRADPTTTAGPIPNAPGGGTPGGGTGGGTRPPGTGTPGGGSGGGTGGGSNVGTSIPGYNGNFNYQINGRQLQITGGVITKNTLLESDWAAADAAFFKMTGKHLPPFRSGTTAPPPPGTTTPQPGAGAGTNFNPGFSNGVGNAPVNGGFPGPSNLYRPQSGSIGVGGGGYVTPTTPAGPNQPLPPGTGGGGGRPRRNWEWIKGLFGGLFGNIFDSVPGVNIDDLMSGLDQGTSTAAGGGGSNQSISRQWTDAKGNNFNIQADVNAQSNVSTNTGGITSGLPASSGQTQTNNGQATQTQTNNGTSSINGVPQGGSSNSAVNTGGSQFIRDANGNIVGVTQGGQSVNGATGIVTQNGQVVNGPAGTVIQTQTSNQSGGGTGPGGGDGGAAGPLPTDALGRPYMPYPTRARRGSITEPVRGHFRSGQDLTKPFFDYMPPAPPTAVATSGVLGSNFNGPGGPPGGGGGGGIGLPNLGDYLDFINDILANAFRNISINLSTNAFIDSNQVYDSTKKFFGVKLGTVLK